MSEKEEEEGASNNNAIPCEPSSDDEPSMSLSLFLVWVLPVLLLAVVSRYAVDTSIPTIPGVQKSKISNRHPSAVPSAKTNQRRATSPPASDMSPSLALSRQPTAYQEVVEVITRRRRKSFQTRKEGYSQSTVASTPSPQPKPTSSDPQRSRLMEKIESFRLAYEDDPSNIYKALEYADAMRFYDLQFHDGGRFEQLSIQIYDNIVQLGKEERRSLIQSGKATKGSTDVAEEVTLEYKDKSADGLMCAIYVAQGKVFYMANMFERAAESYSNCLHIAPDYLDALNARGSTNIILGKYSEAAKDFQIVITKDSRRLFPDAFTGITRVLATKEDATEAGWDGVIPIARLLIATLEKKIEAHPQAKAALSNTIVRLQHVMFTYNDVKTKDHDQAWEHLTQAYRYKMSILPPWKSGRETNKVSQSKEIFVKNFWPPGVGSETKVPVFIIGFVRSGSTLLERVLDAHPMIVGTGENSVFNGRLEHIRNKIVETSVGADYRIGEVTRELAEDVVDGMRARWMALEKSTLQSPNETLQDPQRFVDKMLTNYYNVGFIHMLYPNAVILHVFREPMDTIFSAYKHEFPPGTLDYTSEFEGLAELYHCYRDIMEHWDSVLPGRIMHVRYEDMVHDMPGMARAIVDAVDLPWDDEVLNFHKKKQAVNTLSTTQVRKGVYKDSLQSWRKYELHLQDLIEKIGDRVTYNLQTSLPRYTPLKDSDDEASGVSEESRDEL